jgi:hypothetical protein
MSQEKNTQQATGSTSTGSTSKFRNVASFCLQYDGNDKFRLSMTDSKPVIIPRHSPSISSADETDDYIPRPQQDSLDPFFERFFPNVVVITTLGSSITLALIISQLQDPEDGTVARHSLFNLSTVRILIATSWLLFTITLILSFFLLGWLKHLQGKTFHSENDGYWMVALLYFFIMGAFICLSLAVAAYVDVIGFIAVAILGTLLSLPIVFYCLSFVVVHTGRSTGCFEWLGIMQRALMDEEDDD